MNGKKKTKRGLARPAPPDVADEEVQNTDLYSVNLFSTLSKIPSIPCQFDSDSDEKDEGFVSLFDKKNIGKTQVKAVEKPESDEERKGVCVLTSDSDSDSNCENIAERRSLSPSPPPSQGKVKNRHKRRKTVENQIKKLVKVKQHLRSDTEDATSPAVTSFNLSQGEDTIENKPIQVKVECKSGLHRFNTNMDDCFSGIMEEIATLNGVTSSQVVLFFNDVRVNRWNTPASLNLTIADILECHIRKPEECEYVTTTPDNSQETIKLKFLGKSDVSTLILRTKMSARMEHVLKQYAERMEVPYKSLVFTFDGETINGSDTAEDLDLDDGFCIDVKNVR